MAKIKAEEAAITQRLAERMKLEPTAPMQIVKPTKSPAAARTGGPAELEQLGGRVPIGTKKRIAKMLVNHYDDSISQQDWVSGLITAELDRLGY